MNDKCQIHHNQPVFYGPWYCVQVWKDFVGRYFNYHPKNQKCDERTDRQEDPYIPPTIVERGYKYSVFFYSRPKLFMFMI